MNFIDTFNCIKFTRKKPYQNKNKKLHLPIVYFLQFS